MEFDKDLRSIQEVRNLVARAVEAQRQLSELSQEQIDHICREVAAACAAQAERLAKLAVEETGFGVWQDKVLKNLLGSTMTWEAMKDLKTVGILRECPEKGIWEVGVPVGVVAALIPSTNPTSTTMYKTLISIKAGNAIVISPHPNAKNCILETYQVIVQAAKAAGCPDGVVQCITTPSMQGTDALIKHRSVGLILATGGEAMVRAAYSSGNPALGVGPGNGPSYIEKSADIPAAARRIVASKTFDNGTICASEQSVVTEACVKDQVVAALKAQGCYFLSPEEADKLSRFILRPNGTMNPAIVGRSAAVIADLAGFPIPQGTKVLVVPRTEVKKGDPFMREKLCPILAFFVEDGWQSACERCLQILQIEGAGHTMSLHSQDKAVIREFALKKPVSRLLVNTSAALGGVGAITGLQPALTLGCGAVGGSATSDNVGPMNLLNIRRVAWGLKEVDDLRREAGQAVPASAPAAGCGGAACAPKPEAKRASSLSREDIEAITRAVIARLSN